MSAPPPAPEPAPPSAPSSPSEGHPSSDAWYVTEPDGSPPTQPTSTAISFPLLLDAIGNWTIELVVGYLCQAPGGGTYQAEASTTIQVEVVVTSLELSSTRITTEESLTLDGTASRWSDWVTLADVPALLRELAAGDGTAVIDAGGGDLSAPGGDVTRDWLLTSSDIKAILAIPFAGP